MVSWAQSRPLEGQANAMRCVLARYLGIIPTQSTTIRTKKAVRKDNPLPALRLMQFWV